MPVQVQSKSDLDYTWCRNRRISHLGQLSAGLVSGYADGINQQAGWDKVFLQVLGGFISLVLIKVAGVVTPVKVSKRKRHIRDEEGKKEKATKQGKK